MADLDVDIIIEDQELARLIRQYPNRLKRAVIETRDETLQELELFQVLKYTSTSNPPLPPGSLYDRTFTLRRGSRTRKRGNSLGNISGEFGVEGDEYLKVIGKRSEQADIHKGRWQSEEDHDRFAQKRAEELLNEKIERIRT